MKIKLEKPVVFEGRTSLLTAEFRRVNLGEVYVDSFGHVCKWDSRVNSSQCHFMVIDFPVIRKYFKAYLVDDVKDATMIGINDKFFQIDYTEIFEE